MCGRKSCRARRRFRSTRYFEAFEAAVAVFGHGQVSTYILAGLGDAQEAILATCQKLIALGVYPFVVPFVPISGTPSGKSSAARGSVYASDSAAAGADAARRRAASDRDQGRLRPMRRLFGAFDLRTGGDGMIFEPFPEFLPSEYRIKFATESWERREAAALRRLVFCDEQKIFNGDDRDEIDDRATTIVAISSFAVAPQEVVGTVRIHEAEPGIWWGSRLAVAEGYRRISALGTSLIRLAVSSAHARGCMRFYAHVQSQNAPMFRRLYWSTIDEVVLHGRPHHFMRADLNHYPPIADAETGFLSLPKAA